MQRIKKLEGHGVSLSNAPSRLEVGGGASINKNRDKGCGDAGHNKSKEGGEKLKKNRACLMKDHSSLSKPFSRSIFRSIFPFLPVTLLK